MLKHGLEWLTPLLWGDPGWTIMRRIYDESRKACGQVPRYENVMWRQSYLRRVSRELDRRLRIYGILVEGLTD